MATSCATFADIHCHLLPDLDDGARSWDETLSMARMAVADGIQQVVATPHQLGAFRHNTASAIRQRLEHLRRAIAEIGLPLHVLPGADVRVEPDVVRWIEQGDVLTLGDRRRHVLLELPPDLEFPFDALQKQLERAGLAGIVSHPERHPQLAEDPLRIEWLVELGFLMQITADSLEGGFGRRSRELAHWMLAKGLVHLVATDAHGARARRPLLSHAYVHVADLTDRSTADDLFVHHPRAVFLGREVPRGVRRVPRSGWNRWLHRRKAS